MDYTALAAELLDKMQMLNKAGPHRPFIEGLQGGAFVLHYITLKGGDVLPGEIGQEMGVSSARVAAALNGLEDKGLITRRIDKNDRRKILVGITQEGKQYAERHYQKVLETAVKLLELLGEKDATEYVRISGRLAETMMAQEGNIKCCN